MMTRSDTAPLVSVIVPTHNRGRILEEGIANVLAGCADVPAEVIYVNDSSTDETKEILERYSASQSIKYATGTWTAPGPARNAGAALARGHYLLFTDDDCTVPPRWAADMISVLERRGVDALTGGFEPASLETPAERYFHYKDRLVFGSRPKPVRVAPGMCLLTERATFDSIGGFSEARLSSMEDWEFCYRLTGHGYTLFYDPAVRVRHAYGRKWRYVWKRTVGTGWLGPTVWRLSGRSAGAKLARDGLRFIAAPLWCLRYFPAQLYLAAVALECVYFATRLAGVIAAPFVLRRLGSQCVPARYRRDAGPR